MGRKNYKWNMVADWSDLEATIPTNWGNLVGEADIDQFANEAFALAALSTGADMRELVDMNFEFYQAKEQLFEEVECVREDDPRLIRVEQLLRVPA